MKKPRPRLTKEIILAKASPEPNTGCWLWTQGDNGRGYGRTHYKGSMRQAHRVFYELLKGPIPDGLELDHKCSVTFCVNPDHLDPVPHAVNVRRGRASETTAAMQRAKTHCPYGHEYSGENLIMRNNGARGCRACCRARDKARLPARLLRRKLERLRARGAISEIEKSRSLNQPSLTGSSS